VQLFEKLQSFDREKIPPRNVHALGFGAYGQLTITNDISKYSKAIVFSEVGKTVEFFARLSGTFTEPGEAQTIRDLRGFALKFYTEAGNWDLMTINTPVFAVRDSKPGPDAVHGFKRDPRTSMWNQTQFWDYNATHPEGLHQVAWIFTDEIGTPMSMRYQDWWACNTYSLINAQNQRTWVKFHLKNQQGPVKGFTLEESRLVAGEDPDFLSRDLNTAIQLGKFPSWKLMIQVMAEEEGYSNRIAFDCTKVWPEDKFPLIEVGEIVLNRLPVNYFSEVEQVAFSPATVIPGIGHSPDKLLQGRMLIYDDTQRHRIGPNFKQLPINCPHKVEVHNNYYGGSMNFETVNKFPHYAPSMLGNLQPDPSTKEPPLRCDGPVNYYDYPGEGSDEDYFEQVAAFWAHLSNAQKMNLCKNLGENLAKVTEPKIIDKMISLFTKCSKDWGHMVEDQINTFKTAKPDTQRKVEQFAKDLLV